MTSLERMQAKPTMSNLIALTMSYDLFYKMLKAPIILLVGLPTGLRVSQFFLDRLTNNHTIVSLLIAWASTWLIRQLIRDTAPNMASAQDALAKTQLRLPLIAFFAACIVSHSILTPIGNRFGIQAWLTWSPTVTYAMAFRGSLCTLLLGLSVISRYVGPPSVMRCSSSPLLAHPFQTAIQSLVANLTVDGLLDLIAAPSSEMPGQVIHSPFEYRGTARRFQYPVWRAIFAQILLTIILAFPVAYLLILPFGAVDNTWSEPPGNMGITLACIVSSLAQLVASALNGRGHELNPLQFQSQISWTTAARSALKSLLANLLIPALIPIPLIAIYKRYYSWDDQNSITANEEMWVLAGTGFLVGASVFLYLEVFDQTLRQLLCNNPGNMRDLIAAISDDNSNETFLEVTMISVLHSDMRLVESLGLPTNRNYQDMEREELRRNESARTTMATTLLSKSTLDDMGAHLEEDILRLWLLASLGGGSNVEDYSSAIQTNIDQWIQPVNFPSVTTLRREPEVVPLVRAINAYIGGLGEALIICSGQKSSARVNPWMLPSGAICCAIYAVRAVARLILYNLTVSTRTLADWRSTHLSMLIPVFFSSVHRLEEGMLKFTQESRSDNLSITNYVANIELFRNVAPEFLPLHQEVMECSVAILEKLKSLEGMRKVHFTVTLECSRWIESLLASIPNQDYQSLSPRSVVPFKGL